MFLMDGQGFLFCGTTTPSSSMNFIRFFFFASVMALLDNELNEKLSTGDGSNPGVKKFPLKNTQIAAVISGVHTEFVLTKYANCFFVMITQTGKPGTIVSVYLLMCGVCSN